MIVYNLTDKEQLENLLEDVEGWPMPVWLYKSEAHQTILLVSWSEITEDEVIAEVVDWLSKVNNPPSNVKKVDSDATDEDTPLWEDGDEVEDWMLF
jgi:hypothetical protein